MNKIILLTLSILATSVNAQSTGPREIKQVGCHLNDSTCYVTLDKSVGPDSCNSTSIRWNKDHSDSGKETLSLIMAAAASGNKVSFEISDECYINQKTFPTFYYINVYF